MLLRRKSASLTQQLNNSALLVKNLNVGSIQPANEDLVLITGSKEDFVTRVKSSTKDGISRGAKEGVVDISGDDVIRQNLSKELRVGGNVARNAGN